MNWTMADEQKAHEIDWKHAKRRIPGLRRWKVMTQNKARNAFCRIFEHYAAVFHGDLEEAWRVAHVEMRELYGVEYNDGVWCVDTPAYRYAVTIPTQNGNPYESCAESLDKARDIIKKARAVSKTYYLAPAKIVEFGLDNGRYQPTGQEWTFCPVEVCDD